MDLRPLALALALAAPTANAACESWMTPGTDTWSASCNGGREFMDDYPKAQDYGTRTDVYVRDNGQVEVFEHQATGQGDNLRIYDYESSMRVDQGGSTEIQGYDPDALHNWSK